MEAAAKQLFDVLNPSQQYLVPFFQRNYSWHRKQWDKLWLDIEYLLGEGRGRMHFLGPLVLTPANLGPSDVHVFQIIDGQQRLTTLTITLAALRDIANVKKEKKFAQKVEQGTLMNVLQDGDTKYKVLPRTGDREPYQAIIDGKYEDAPRSLGIRKAYDFFRHKLEQALATRKVSLEDMRNAIVASLNLVVITIAEQNQNPYEILESLNATGLKLEESDLIRNYIFMRIPAANQDAFNRKHWQAFENLFEGVDEEAKLASQFYRNYLMKDGKYIERAGIFVSFKEQFPATSMNPVTLVQDLTRFAKCELDLTNPKRVEEASVRRELGRIQMLDIATGHPLLMNMLDRWRQGKLSEKELLQALRDLQSFVLRRSVCGESTRRYGRWFVELAGQLGKDPAAALRAYLFRRGWPDNKFFQQRLLEFPLYHRERSKARLILDELENAFGHKEAVDLKSTKISIEHMMPRSIANNGSGREWMRMLGDRWREVKDRWLDTLGNLTLTGYNSDMSNKPFERKKKEIKRSKLGLNRHFQPLKRWNEKAIRKRGELLSKQVASLFPRPKSDVDYVPSAEASALATVESGGQKFRKEYWSLLNEQLAEVKSYFVRKDVTDKTWQPLPSPFDDNCKLWAKAAPNLKELRIDLVFLYKLGRAAFEHLLDLRDEMKGNLGAELFWAEDSSPPFISFSREDAEVREEANWPAQHEWFMDRFDEFERIIFPALRKIMKRLDGGSDEEE